MLEDIEIVGETRGIYIKSLESLAVADLHLGLEEAYMKQGLTLPRSQYPKIKKMILEFIENYDPERIIINGDVKHEFGEQTIQEYIETKDLLLTLKRVTEVLIVRGNHDNYLISILKRIDIPIYNPTLKIGDYIFTHGHREVDYEGTKNLVIAHEHPAITLRDELGVKNRFRCLLEGYINGTRILVLPALSPLAGGTEINLAPRDKLLSPILRKIGVEDLIAHVKLDEKVYSFPISLILPRKSKE